MAKAAIRKIKERRFWRWLCVEVYGHPKPKQPIKRRPKSRRNLTDKQVSMSLKRAGIDMRPIHKRMHEMVAFYKVVQMN